jgi:hypothetical protein
MLGSISDLLKCQHQLGGMILVVKILFFFPLQYNLKPPNTNRFCMVTPILLLRSKYSSTNNFTMQFSSVKIFSTRVQLPETPVGPGACQWFLYKKSCGAVCLQNTNCQGSFKKYLVQLLFESTAAPSTRCGPGAAPPHLFIHWSASGKIRLG